MMLDEGTRTFSKSTSKCPPWMASRHRTASIYFVINKKKVFFLDEQQNPTVLSEHCDWSDELYTRCVHRYQDHTVLTVPKIQDSEKNGLF